MSKYSNRKKDNPTPEERREQERAFEEYQKALKEHREIKRREKEMEDEG